MQGEKLGHYLFLNESLIRCKRPRRKVRGILRHWHLAAIVMGICMVVMAFVGH